MSTFTPNHNVKNSDQIPKTPFNVDLIAPLVLGSGVEWGVFAALLCAKYTNFSPNNDRHHRRSRSRSPVSPEWAGETPAEREERRLAEAAVLVGPPAGQPRAASADTGPSTQEPEPAEVTAPAAQAASPAAPPREGAPDARGAETAAPASHAAAPTAAPGTPPTRGVAPAQEPGASPRAAAAAEGSGEGARGVATAAPASRATASAGHAAAPSTPRKRGKDPARRAGPRAPRRRPPQQQQWAGRARSTAPTPTPPTPTPAPPSRSPPSPSPRGGRGTSAPRCPSARRRASRCRSCKGSGTPGA